METDRWKASSRLILDVCLIVRFEAVARSTSMSNVWFSVICYIDSTE